MDTNSHKQSKAESRRKRIIKTTLCLLLSSALLGIAQEVSTEVKVIVVRMKCECGGEMKPTGQCLTSYPPQYPHVCDKCGKKVTYRIVYPDLRYENK